MAQTQAQPEGIDVSNHNGVINWQAVKDSGISFAYIKAVEADFFTDPYFAGPLGQNRRDAQNVGIIAGAYLYFRPGVDPIRQAQHFFDVCGVWMPGELPPCLDFEEAGTATPAQLVSAAQTCLAEIERLFKCRPMIYTYKWYYIHSVANSGALATYPLWVAQYPGPPDKLGAWPSYTMHQYSATGPVVPGIVGAQIDRDRFNGTLDDLRAFCGLQRQNGGTQLIIAGAKYPITQAEFIRFYQSEPKAAQYFGLPITPTISEKLSDGNTYTVQYFERARFELHPSGVVMLGLVGSELLALKG